MHTTALLGYSGFVGSTLLRQTPFDDLYNSQNIGDIRGRGYDLIVCAAAPAAKWKANQQPEADLANLHSLMAHLEQVTAGRLILISTVDVFRMPSAPDEQTPIDPQQIDFYGRHRYQLEQFIQSRFANTQIVRLPGLFGAGLRKNFLFDLIHRGESEWTHAESVFQFYNMAHLWEDLQRIERSQAAVIHLATTPVKAADVARYAFDLDYTHQTANPPVHYDLRTRYAHLWGKTGDYIATAEETYEQIRAFARSEKADSIS